MKDNDLASTLSRLYSLRASDIKFGIETEAAILNRLGNPERGWRSIHVAGTNGKGSVCAMIESVLRAAGYKTGLYTSPHLVSFNERIRVNGRCITDAQLSDLIRQVEDAAGFVQRQPGGRNATFFEIATAIGFEYFRQQGVNIAVLETGMGGRLDATNVVMPMLSVITSISIEHTAWLGEDIESIAREKCGIIKPGIPIVVGNLDSDALNVAVTIARELRAPIIRADEYVSVQQLSQDISGINLRVESQNMAYGSVVVPLIGAKTPENIAIAIAAMESMQDDPSFRISAESVKRGLAETRWPGRFHVVSQRPPVIVDGAHNPEAAGVLVKSLRSIFGQLPLGLVLGIAADKDLAGFLRPFAGLVKRCWAVPIRSERSRPTSEVAAEARRLGCPVIRTEVRTAVNQAEKWAVKNKGGVCIAGSFFLAGEVIEMKCGKRLFE